MNEVDAKTARDLRRALLAWFRREKRDLPWRKRCTPYRVWLSEIILQQTRVDQGLPYYERMVAAFPSVEALAHAPLDAVLKQWEGLGYYTRARNLHKAARLVAREGRFPETAEAWRALPGVGRYTANAISSIAQGERVPVVDGNVERVLARVFDIGDRIDDRATQQRLWALGGRLVPAKSPGDFNQALMELGARVCVPRRPLCAACPLRRLCKAYAAGTQEARPVRAIKKPTPRVQCVAAVIEKRGRLLLARRPESGMLGGLWEFPSIEMAADGAPEEAVRAAMLGTFGIEVSVEECAGAVSHAYSHRHVTMRLYRCAHTGGSLKTGECVEAKWVLRKDLASYALPGICRKALRLLG